jgi:hypothetical protein
MVSIREEINGTKGNNWKQKALNFPHISIAGPALREATRG